MRILNHWEQMLGLTISAAHVEKGDAYLAIKFTDSSAVYIESTQPDLPLYLDFYSLDATPDNKISVKPSRLVGKIVSKVAVPYLAPGFRDEAFVTLMFSDGEGVIIAAEDWFIGLRIT